MVAYCFIESSGERQQVEQFAERRIPVLGRRILLDRGANRGNVRSSELISASSRPNVDERRRSGRGSPIKIRGAATSRQVEHYVGHHAANEFRKRIEALQIATVGASHGFATLSRPSSAFDRARDGRRSARLVATSRRPESYWALTTRPAPLVDIRPGSTPR